MVIQDKHLAIGRERIEEFIPQRHPFLMVDEIAEFSAGVSCRALKFVDPADPVFEGHFPGRPVMPGVLIVEAMAQAACFLLSFGGGSGIPIANPVLGQVTKCSFLSLVRPGDTLEIEVRLSRLFEGMAMLTGTASVSGRTSARAELVVNWSAGEGGSA